MKKLVLGMMLAPASLTAFAADNHASNHWVGGVSYTSLSLDLALM